MHFEYTFTLPVSRSQLNINGTSVMGLPDLCIQGLDIQYPVNSFYTVPVCMLR